MAIPEPLAELRAAVPAPRAAGTQAFPLADIPGAPPNPFTRHAVPPIIAVAGWKGGIGKSLLAYELAWLLGAVLADVDWDAGGVTVKWGYRPLDRVKAVLLDALETGRTPKPLTGVRKPRLIPSHPDLSTNQPAPEAMAAALERWVREYGVPVVVDTHPGGLPSTYGAMAAASLVVVPAVLKTAELNALEAMLAELPDYPIVLVPNMIPNVPPAPELARLTKMAKGVPVLSPIHLHTWLGVRKQRVAVTSYDQDQEPKRVARLAEELRTVASQVVARV